MDRKDTPIDREELLEIMDDDDELLKECFDDFLNDYPDMLSQLKDAIESGDAKKLEMAAHTFKGSLKYLAATSAAKGAHELEMMGRHGDMKDAFDVFSNLEVECERIKEYIMRYQQHHI